MGGTVQSDGDQQGGGATIGRAELIEAARQAAFLNRGQASELVETFLALIGDSLLRGEPVLISGFGKFVVKRRRARKARNIRAGVGMEIPERSVVSFRPSQRLVQRLNSGASRRTERVSTTLPDLDRASLSLRSAMIAGSER